VAAESAMPLILQKTHALRMDCADPVWVSGDAARLVQIMVNLLTNAAKFTPRGGEIVLHVGRSGDSAEIGVRDNGPGIEPELLPNIFKLFFQGEQDLARAQGGLGLGLSLVRELVKLHGGQISVFNLAHPQSGSEFIVQLPAIASPVALSAAAPRSGRGQRQQILVVDDNRDAADTMRLLLEALGYTAEVLYDGDSVLSKLKAARPELVLLDIGLPGISGLELAARIKAEIPDPPPLVALTGYGQDRDRAASLRAGFQEHLVKPVSLDELTALLGRVFKTLV
jgi:CheY-like chemotaxis protein